jgi:hypothetical protein
MAIDSFLIGQAFDPRAIREMSLALDSVAAILSANANDTASRGMSQPQQRALR